MSNFLFVFTKGIKDYIFLYNVLPIFKENYKRFEIKNVEIKDVEDGKGVAYQQENDFFKNINDNISFSYNEKNTDIITIDKEFTENVIDSHLKTVKKNYEAIFIFHFGLGMVKTVSNKYNNIFIECDETLPVNRKKIINQILKTKSNKIITTGKVELIQNENIFSNYKLAFHFFYYYLGFYHLSLEEFNIEKQNLLGTYLKKNYVNDRDVLYNKILKKFKDKNKLKNYSTNFDFNLSLLLDLKFHDGWIKNHISTYTDYMKSLFILNFESDAPCVIENYHITEKTIKSILFSKLNIPTILFAHQDMLLKLKEDGFWFLNFDFIDFDQLKNWKKSDNKEGGGIIVNNSVMKSIDFILELDKKFKGNKKEIQNYIVKNYSNKLQNNYKLFKNILNDIDIKKEMFEIITNRYKKWNQNTHLI